MSARMLEKPVDSTWTDEQWDAIAARGSNVLVAAAAGSGKTAVLVERIIRRITDEQQPLSVDNLLVVTFTNAAAAEMRHRIGAALEKEAAAQSSSYLRRQVTLLNRASITTLHSFCMEVLRRYYYLIDLDPSFRIADSTEAQLLRQEAMEDMLEEEYAAEENPSFFRLVDSYTGDRGDEALQHIILRLYEFARSHPWPDHWLDDMAAMYRVETLEDFYGLPWFRYLRHDVELELNGALALLRQGAEVAQMVGGPLPYLANFTDDTAVIEELLTRCAGPWNELYEAFQRVAFGKLKPCKKKECDEALIDKAKKLRDRVKDMIGRLQQEMFAIPPDQYFALNQEIAPLIDKLIALVRRFGARYSERKQAKGLVDFSDLEHYCLRVLRHEEAAPGDLRPSAAALEYRAQFGEVLVDEYQDTNEVQETIVRLVTKDSEAEGNLFMVGDVKQSIVRP